MLVTVTGYEGKVHKDQGFTEYWIVFRREEGGNPFLMKGFFNEIINTEEIQQILFKKGK